MRGLMRSNSIHHQQPQSPTPAACRPQNDYHLRSVSPDETCRDDTSALSSINARNEHDAAE